MKLNQKHGARSPHALSLLLACALLAGCATGPNANARDPLEPFNRGVYKFNDALDTAVLKPVATAYQDVIPKPVRQGVSNFFGNLDDAWSFVNNALQFKGEAALESLFRFGVNSTIGLGGILDVASEMKLEKHSKDFGLTLGYWGVGPGPYLVLPLLGPSTLRDTAALPVDTNGNLATHISDVPTRNTVRVVKAIDDRAALLQAGSILEEAALDKYTFIRDSFLQHRQSAVYDGNPPEDDTEEKWQPEQAVDENQAETLKDAAPAASEVVKP